MTGRERSAATGRIQVTITGWYTPRDDAYPADCDTIEAKAAYDYASVQDNVVDVAETVEWFEEYKVEFDAEAKS